MTYPKRVLARQLQITTTVMKPQKKLKLIVDTIGSYLRKIVMLCSLSIGLWPPPYPVHANESCSFLLSDMNLTRSTDPRLIYYGRCAGLCAITATTNSMQLALNDLGQPLLVDPLSIINQINENYPETRGNTAGLPSLDKTIQLISDLVIAKTGFKITYNILALPFPWNTPSPNITYSLDLTNHSFATQPGERNILTYMMFRKSDDGWLGTHAVSLLRYSSIDGIAKVVDPNMPTIPLYFKVQKEILDDNEGTTFEMIPISPEFFKMYPDSRVRVHSIANIRVRR